MIGFSELRYRGRLVFAIASSPAGLLWGLFATLTFFFFFFLLLAIGLFVGVGFGPFYLLLGAATIIFVFLPAMWIPPLGQRIDALTPRQIVIGAATIVAAAFITSFHYVAIAWSAGIAIRFAEAVPT